MGILRNVVARPRRENQLRKWNMRNDETRNGRRDSEYSNVMQRYFKGVHMVNIIINLQQDYVFRDCIYYSIINSLSQLIQSDNNKLMVDYN